MIPPLFQHTPQPEGWSDDPEVVSTDNDDGFQHTPQPEGWSDALDGAVGRPS